VAAALNNVESIKALLDSGAEVDVADSAGDTPLALAQRFNKPEAVHLLQTAATQQRPAASNGAVAAASAPTRIAGPGGNRRKIKLHLESGTGLFENPALPPLSPTSTRSHAAAATTTASPPPQPSTSTTSTTPTAAATMVRGHSGNLPAVSGSSIVRRPGAAGGHATMGSGSPPPARRGSTDGGEGMPHAGGGWKKKDWTETAAPFEKGKVDRSRGKTELLSLGGASGQGTEGWKKMKSFFSTSVHPLPHQPPSVDVLQQQLLREQSGSAPPASSHSFLQQRTANRRGVLVVLTNVFIPFPERRQMEVELRMFKQRAGPLMYQLKRRYVECYDANTTLTLRNEHLERELEALRVNKAAGAPAMPSRDKKPPSPESTLAGGVGRPVDFMTREKMLEAREKKEWRNTRMMMVESHKTEKLELMAQVEELREKLKGLTKDLLEVLDENEKLVKQLEIVEEERDKCIKLMESKIS
jgi:regulator of replication initiation timing